MSDENGIRELDHILPKNPSKTRTQNKRVSSAYKDRRHTNGYSAFTYEPLNLVITCKQCNTYKGLFDPLRNRHLPIQSYPISADAFDSIHPHFHRYSQHINIFQGWIYEGVTSQGKFLIGCCKLDEAEVLARRKLATAYTAQSINLIDCLWKFVGARHALTIPECAASISDTFKIPYNEAFHLVSVWFLEETMTEGFTRALDAAKPYINNQKRH
ncbi:hypothetical protein [Methylophilus sp. 5]|uniref:hypothetical protein n=1 Tax=Methylophilus sp. 5 TaxID=1112274 RepID=UPI0012F866FE|nr:hypothetical protein [Methylophilus sp. 5]